MKKSILFLVFIGVISLQSCTVNENTDAVDNDTISEVFEFTNVNFLPNNYSVNINFPHSIYASDMVLVYRLAGTYQGQDVWKQVPETYYFDDGTLDFRYDFDFTKYDVSLYLEGYNLPSLNASYRLNQIFRVVIVPGYFGNKSSQNVDFSDYHAVIQAYHIDDTKIKR